MGQRGTTLIELLIFTVVAAIILLAVGSFYVSMGVSYNQGNAQAFVQRQGTMVQEELSRQILPAISVRPWGCGPGAVGLAVQRTADFLCFYIEGQQIFECTIAPDSLINPTSTACAGPARDLLYGSPIRIRANSLTFTRGAAGSTVDIIFALTEEELDSRIVVDPIQFAMGIRLRNS